MNKMDRLRDEEILAELIVGAKQDNEQVYGRLFQPRQFQAGVIREDDHTMCAVGSGLLAMMCKTDHNKNGARDDIAMARFAGWFRVPLAFAMGVSDGFEEHDAPRSYGRLEAPSAKDEYWLRGYAVGESFARAMTDELNEAEATAAAKETPK